MYPMDLPEPDIPEVITPTVAVTLKPDGKV